METATGGRQRAAHRRNNNRTSNKFRVNELTDSLQAELHLSLERLSDGELDQDDLKRLKQRSNHHHKHYNDDNGDDDSIIDTQDSLELIENKKPLVRSSLPRLLQRASEGGDILDSLDATDLQAVDEEDEEAAEEEDEGTYRGGDEKSAYDQLIEDSSAAADPYADLRYNYLPNGNVLKPVENFIDDVSNDDSEYRYYDDGGSTLTEDAIIGGGKGKTPELETPEPDAASLQAENDLLEEEYRKFFNQTAVVATRGKAPPSGNVSSRASRETVVAAVAPGSARTVTVKQPNIYREQFDRSAQRLRHTSVSSTTSSATAKTTTAKAGTNKTTKIKQPPAQPIHVKNIIERNRARAGQKSSSASYLEIHSKKRSKKQAAGGSNHHKTASVSASNLNKASAAAGNLPELPVAKSESDLLRRGGNNDDDDVTGERSSAEETWLRQQHRLKAMRKGGPKKPRPPKPFLKISAEKKTASADTAPAQQRHVAASNHPQQPPPQQQQYDLTNPYPLLPPQRIQPYGMYQQLPHNGNMSIDPYINGGYYYPPPPPQQVPIYYQQQIDPSPPLPPPQPHRQPLPPIPRSSPQKTSAETSPTSAGQSPPSKPQRSSLPNNYRKYTLDDYRNFKRDQGQLGGLGPDLSTAKTKAENVARARQYAESIRHQNRTGAGRGAPAAQHPRVQAEEDAEAAKRKRMAARQRALSYAREVPKPKAAPQVTAAEANNDEQLRQASNRKSRIPRPEGGTTARRDKSKEEQRAAADHLKRRSSSTFTIDKSGTSPRTGGGGVDLDLIRALRERHEREKAMVAQITAGK